MKFIKGSSTRYAETVILGAGISITEDGSGRMTLISSGTGGGGGLLGDLTNVTDTSSGAGWFMRSTAAATWATQSGVNETDINDGSIYARLAADETVTGAWTFNPGSVVIGTEPGGSDPLRVGGNILASGIVKSVYGSIGVSVEHIRIGKIGSPTSGNPYYTWKLGADATPAAELQGWNGTTAQVFYKADYANSNLYLRPTNGSVIVGPDPGGSYALRVGGGGVRIGGQTNNYNLFIEGGTNPNIVVVSGTLIGKLQALGAVGGPVIYIGSESSHNVSFIRGNTPYAVLEAGVFRPNSAGGTSLGSSSVQWSRLFLLQSDGQSSIISRVTSANQYLVSKQPALQIVGADSGNLNNPPNIALIAPDVGSSADQNQSIGKLELISSRSTIAQLNSSTFTALQYGDFLGEIRFGGDDGVNIRSMGTRIWSKAASGWNASSHPGNIYLGTVSSGTVGNAVERWMVQHDGHFLSFIDNTYDIGSSGAQRPRTGYFGTSLVIGSDPGSGSPLRVGGSIRIGSNFPQLTFWEEDGAADEKAYDFYMNGGTIYMRAINDAYTAASNIFYVNRSGYQISNIISPQNWVMQSGIFVSRTVGGSAVLTLTSNSPHTGDLIDAFSDGGTRFVVNRLGYTRIAGETGSEVLIVSGSLAVRSVGTATLIIEADKNNDPAHEGDHPTLSYRQDGNAVRWNEGIDGSNNYYLRDDIVGRDMFVVTWNSTPSIFTFQSNVNVVMTSDPAGGVSNTGILRIGGGGQSVRTSGYIMVSGSSTANFWALDSSEAQMRLQKTGANANLTYLFNNGASSGYYDSTSGRIVWSYTVSTNIFTHNSAVYFQSDNTYDIGAAASNRPKDVYIAGSISQGAGRHFITYGTQTSTAALRQDTVTWNNASQPFEGWKLTVANTASHGASTFLKFLLSPATTVFSIARDGGITIGAAGSVGTPFNVSAQFIVSGTSQLSAMVFEPTFHRTVTSAGFGIRITPRTETASFNMSTYRGIHIDNGILGGGSSITDAYGVYISAMSYGSSNNYAIYTAGAGLVSFGDDLIIGTLGRFDSTSTPQDGYILRYDAGTSKWKSEIFQTEFAQGDVVASIQIDNTRASYVNTVTTPAGTPTNPTGAQDIVLTPIYKGMIVDCSAYGALPANQQFVAEYSINSGSSWTALPAFTGTSIVHSNLNLPWGYRYRYKVRGATDSTYSDETADTLPNDIARTNAYDVIVASQISTANLAAISANLGSITTGILQNLSGTAGMRLSNDFSLPGTWNTYLDLVASGAGNILKVGDSVTISAAGGASFAGNITANSLRVIGSSILSGTSIVPDSGSLAVSRFRLSEEGYFGNTTKKSIEYEDGTLVMYGDVYSGTFNPALEMGNYTLAEGTGLTNRVDSGWIDPLTSDGVGSSYMNELAELGGPIDVTLASGSMLQNLLGAPLENQNINSYNSTYTVRWKQRIVASGLTDPNSYSTVQVKIQYQKNGGIWKDTNSGWHVTTAWQGNVNTEEKFSTVTITQGDFTSLRFRLVHKMTCDVGIEEFGYVSSFVYAYATTWGTDNYKIEWTSGTVSKRADRRNLRLYPVIASGIAQPQIYFQPLTVLLPSGSGTFAGESWFDGKRNSLNYSTGRSTKTLADPKTRYKFQRYDATVIAIGGSAPSTTGTLAQANNDDGGWISQTTANGNGQQSRIDSASTVTRTKWGPVFRARIRTTSVVASRRFWIGLTSTAQTGNSDTGTGSMVMFRGGGTGATDWKGVTRNGASQSETASFGNLVANKVYELQIRVDEINNVAYFSVNDSPEFSLSTTMPATTTNLGLECGVTSTSTTADILFQHMYVDHDEY